MTEQDSDAKHRAIEVHTTQADQFAARYAEADEYGSCFGYSRRRLGLLLEQSIAAIPPGMAALDVGCGTGQQITMLRERGLTVSGIDGSGAMLGHARRANPNCDLRLGDVDALPFAAETFDLALCIEVLRYLPNPRACVRELGRVLRPGGRCLVTATPALNSNGYWLVNRLASALQLRGLVTLKQYFVPSSSHLKRLFEECSFRDVRVQGVYIGPINWIERLAPSSLPTFLRRWEPLDRRLCDQPGLREFANMFLVSAVRA